MILKKEQIANTKIECYISSKIKEAKVVVGNKNFTINLNKVKDVPINSEFDVFTNYLLKINRTLIDLKQDNEDIIHSDLKIIIDNENFVNFIKPEGFILKKITKSFKKSIDNIELKRILGITMHQFSIYENIDIIFKNFNIKEVYNMNEIKNDKIELKEDDNFDLNMDISSFDDIINVSDLNYNEDDLFKGFNLDTNDLFNKTSDELIFKTDDEVNSNEDFIFIEEDNINKGDFILNEDINNKEEVKSKEIALEDDFNINLEENNSDSDEFNVEINFDFDDEKIESNDFIFEDKKENINDIDFSFSSEEIKEMELPIYETKDEVIVPTYETKEEDTPVYETKEEDTLVYETKEGEVTPTYEIKEEDLNFYYNTNEVIEDDLGDIDDKVFIEETYIEDEVVKEVYEIIDSATPDNDIITFNNNSSIEKVEKDEISKIEEKNNSIDTVSNCKEDDKNFIEKELNDLKNILENKVLSYNNKIVEFNSKYEEKHQSLKDLSLRDENRQIEIFREFLDCKSTLISLSELNETCNSIILNINDKISELNK